ncbi:MAG: 2-oxoglutarate dehydrogenase complex dihydrolipoyllysine-residue succinyltransferase [Bacteroidetes bacterium]|nr:MAG: 2-oxoglutarate dehydrogenase complex dihydrolipoyllysine-residue succinyltransferase [Bacteroidota bacterium]REK04862.1 MAG: 2-oxoglutarate dehydrogenase complex dihydrolipoyllysine-residue succinyltransferase [Bacteroidota bacterium]REK36334.1 MAG: 2-oxoglutarate dehydrogenase complex dihydrolipoyllysine-residue succinyltransferase [Bacteroidota bacterium]REK51000.1 MAG: 2-oxoglutarate dehydrogenase complex dihydrolipoyllysine-residue succinyltransferase [Bacteroidota bacterium]
MAIIEMKVPSPGESITEVQIANWLKKDGDYVEKDEELCEIDSDKATLTLNAESEGVLKILVQAGETVAVGTPVCKIDDSAEKPKSAEPAKEKAKASQMAEAKPETASSEKKKSSYASGVPSVAAEKLMRESGIPASAVTPGGKDGRITKGDVLAAMDKHKASGKIAVKGSRNIRREKMSMLRKKVSERLMAVKQETAMLTTFNEVDMSAIMAIRKQYKDKFKESHGVGLGFMSFFTKAVCEALMEFPAVNAQIDGNEIVYHDYCDIGIAVSAPKGLMVPVMRNAESLSLAGIEKAVMELAGKARDGKISIEEMTGGTFTITNGGVFGSMLSTPIINPPQSAILGMHNIVERPVAVNGKVEIRPIMYVALSYDHRIIDGRESVGFLVKVKQMLEEPVKMLYGGKDPVQELLDL